MRSVYAGGTRLLSVAAMKCLKGGNVSTIEQLLDVQDHDLRIQRIEGELRDIPARKARELERLQAHTAALEAAEGVVQERQAELKQNELEVQSKKEKIAKLRTQQMELKTNKEFKTMSSEIETIEKAIRRDEDRELEIMESIEAARADVDTRRKELDAEKAVVQEDIDVLDERVAGLETELKTETELRDKAKDGIDAEWLRRYESILRSKPGSAALVSSEGGVCRGCNMALPPYQQHNARKRVEMVVCSYCGRMLY
jgi:predicted  nucleic acid-binding Zn-ribbon protein